MEGRCSSVPLKTFVSLESILLWNNIFSEGKGFPLRTDPFRQRQSGNETANRRAHMSWFRKSDASAMAGGAKEVAQEKPKTPKQMLEVQAQGFVESALRQQDMLNRRYAWPRSRLEEVCVRDQTLGTVREWFTVEDEEVRELDPDINVFVSSSLGIVGNDRSERATRGLSQADVDNWVGHWHMATIKCGVSRSKGFYTIPHDLDGAAEHRQRIAKLRQARDEKERSDRDYRQRLELVTTMLRLERAAKAPLDYEGDSNLAVEVAEESIYPAFAAQLRGHGIEESTLFDLVAKLSELVEQSRKILPKLTPETVRQFEARVLVSYYEKHTEAVDKACAEELQERERAQAELYREFAADRILGELQETNDQLSSLNASLSNQARDVSRIKWLQMIDGLLGH
jgi:hypothetical protein